MGGLFIQHKESVCELTLDSAAAKTLVMVQCYEERQQTVITKINYNSLKLAGVDICDGFIMLIIRFPLPTCLCQFPAFVNSTERPTNRVIVSCLENKRELL